MQNWPGYRKWIIFFIVLFVVLGIATPVLADYLGPNRTVTQTTTTCQFAEYECKFVPSKNDYRYKRVGSASCGSEDKPWKDSPSDGGDCSASTVGDTYWSQEEKQQEVTTIYPSAVISSSLQNCTLQNGWCGVTAPDLFLSASEPVAGYNILLIEGTRNGEIFACPSGAASCDLSLLEGNNTFAYWALSSWGDSSEMRMSTILVDTVSPDLSLAISGSSGANGWYISPTTITAVGADATSGLFSALLSANGGTLQPSATLNEGVYEIAATASDFAGNISNASATISIDITTPSISAAIQGTTGDNGWYRSVIQVSATATDATSGVSTFEASADGKPYQSYTTPISFSDGHHTIQFKAIDRAGNITETPLQEFYIDTIAPTIHLPSSWQLGSNVSYDVNDDGSGLASLRLVIEDEDERYAKVAWNENVSGEAYSGDIHWNGSFKDKTIAPPGTYLVWLKSTDIAGNEGIKLGKVIVPKPNVFLSMIQPEDSLEETPVPPDDLYDAGEHRPSTPSSTLDFGGSTTEITETTKQSLFLTSGTAATIPSTSSNVLWGAAAAAVISSATAYALAGRREREEAQAEQEAQAAKARDREARKRKRKQQKQQANWIQQQALEQARLLEAERKQQTISNARIEAKMTRLEAEDEAKWIASWTVTQKREAESRREEERQASLKAQYASLQQQEAETLNAQSNWWETTKSFISEAIIEPYGKPALEKTREFVINEGEWISENIYLPHIKPAIERTKEFINSEIAWMNEEIYQPYIKPVVERNKPFIANEIKWVDEKIYQPYIEPAVERNRQFITNEITWMNEKIYQPYIEPWLERTKQFVLSESAWINENIYQPYIKPFVDKSIDVIAGDTSWLNKNFYQPFLAPVVNDINSYIYQPLQKKVSAWWEKYGEWVHNSLDAAGLIPGFGDIADGLNGVVYLGEGR